MSVPIRSSSGPQRTRPHLPRIFFFAGLFVWAGAALAGFKVLTHYELTPGPVPHALGSWPTHTGLQLDHTKLNLLLFAHPQCPCTDATFDELESILTRCGNRMNVTVCFIYPPEEPTEWTTETALWRRARRLPNVRVVLDRNGRLAALFGAITSGHAFLFDGKGERLFSGGITGARGHSGDNRGEQFVIAFARGEISRPEQTPTFGCALRDGDERSGQLQ
jgi:hypothetical protein